MARPRGCPGFRRTLAAVPLIIGRRSTLDGSGGYWHFLKRLRVRASAHGVAEGRALPGGAFSPVPASGKAFDDLDDLVAPEAVVPCVFEEVPCPGDDGAA